MKLILIARRRLDGLIDPQWVEGFEAFKLQGSPNACPYTPDTEEFSSWIEGWMDADKAIRLKDSKPVIDGSSTVGSLLQEVDIC